MDSNSMAAHYTEYISTAFSANLAIDQLNALTLTDIVTQPSLRETHLA